MAIDTHDLKYGFWVGLGFLAAFLVWHLASSALRRARGGSGG
jgi:hypothetical protein